MSFNSAEISTQDGRPVSLYTLKWDKTVWRYTSADGDITRIESIEGVDTEVVYTAKAVNDNGMTQGASSQLDFTLDVPADIPIVALFDGTPPSETIWLTVRRLHLGEDDAPIYWIGNVTNVKGIDLAQAQVIGQPITATFRRSGLRLCWTRECPHFLYDVDCKVNPADFETDAVITAIAGNTATVGVIAFPDQYFRGGYISWEANVDGTIERRMVEDQTGNVLTLFGSTRDLVVGSPIKMYPGCDRSPGTCKDKFNNIDNYGGFDYMPGESPFGINLF